MIWRLRALRHLRQCHRRSLWSFYNAALASLSNSYAICDRYDAQSEQKCARVDTSQSRAMQSLICCTQFTARSIHMDVILVAVALGFFALSIGYTIACDRL
jgi:hypothetical protein